VARIPLARSGSWQFDPSPAHASEIKVRFTADGPDETAVQLEQRHVERVVDGQALRDGITGGGGWSALWSCSPRPLPSDLTQPPSSRTRAIAGRTRVWHVRSGARGGVADADGLDLAGVDGGLLLGLAGIAALASARAVDRLEFGDGAESLEEAEVVLHGPGLDVGCRWSWC
jgi:hypothetical protein